MTTMRDGRLQRDNTVTGLEPGVAHAAAMLSLRSFPLTSVHGDRAVALLAAGCGGSSAPSGPGTHRSVLAYSQCMHAHGVPNFPDPSSSGGIDKGKVIALGSSPQINRAQNACEHTMPASRPRPANNRTSRADQVRRPPGDGEVPAQPRVPGLPRPDPARQPDPPDGDRRRDQPAPAGPRPGRRCLPRCHPRRDHPSHGRLGSYRAAESTRHGSPRTKARIGRSTPRGGRTG